LADFEQTQIVTRAQLVDLMAGEDLHCLELTGGDEAERRHVVTPLGIKIGRTPPADLVLADSDVSRSHCIVTVKDGELLVADFNSTNGTFIDGVRVTQPAILPVGSLLQVGNRTLRHECMTREELARANATDHELRQASEQLRSLLPAPLEDGPVRTDWTYHPSARLGGDGFGYRPIAGGLFAFYLIDVASHGAGATMHAAQVLDRLGRGTLPGADMARPEQVLGALNELFQMEEHAGFYFTAWYGVFDSASRQLRYASGGHHAAYLMVADRTGTTPLQTSNVVIGAMPAMEFAGGSVVVPQGARLYLFSDGAFEIVDRQGTQWSIADFIELVQNTQVEGPGEAQKIYKALTKTVQHGVLEDDFSLVVFEFD
jgi:serine phosphatase RsbU (regulator of sigma subunit)